METEEGRTRGRGGRKEGQADWREKKPTIDEAEENKKMLWTVDGARG